MPFEREELSVENKYNEYILTRLRTSWGIDAEILKNRIWKGTSPDIPCHC